MSSVEFRYIKNHMIDLDDGKYHAIPLLPGRMTMVNTPQGEQPVLRQAFDMDKVHLVELPDCAPHIPKRRDEWSDGFYQKIVDAAHVKAIESRGESAKIIGKIKHYVATGVITVVADPDGVLDEPELSDAELALLNGQSERRDVRSVKPKV